MRTAQPAPAQPRPPRAPRLLFPCALAAAAVASLAACAEETPAPTDTVAAAPDVASVPDVPKAPPQPGDPVGIDLALHIGDTQHKGAYVRRIEAGADLIGGPAAQGKLGDFAIGNGSVRYVIQGDDRHIGPCPWGGTVLDADIVRPAGMEGQDALGEQCLFFHLGRTLRPVRFDILRSGKDGGAAVLAVTGEDTVDDFIHLQGLIAGFVGGEIDLPVDADEDLPLTITRYFVLRPDSPVMTVLTAFRNDGSAPVVTEVGELIDSGGAVQFYNPLSSLKGFGYGGLAAEPMEFIAFRGEQSSHMLSPAPIAGGPGGSYLAISGVAGTLFGTTDPMGLLLSSKDEFAKKSGAFRVAPGQIATTRHEVVVGSGDLSTLTGPLWQARGVPTGKVTGRAVDVDGKGIAGVRLSALDGAKRARTQFVTDKDGHFGGAVPPGTYSFSADAPGRQQVTVPSIEVPAGKSVAAKDAVFSREGHLLLTVVGAAGEPLPAKVTVKCVGPCPDTPESQHRDITFDKKATDIATIEFVPPSGKLDVRLAPGTYRVSVARGPTYSLWPQDAAATGGQVVVVPDSATAIGGATPQTSVNVAATLYKVIDTAGWLSGDFHVHAINSPDAPVPNLDRILSFLGEGVDVVVSTDHDFITDFAPVIALAGGGSLLASIPGVELTTFDYGHFNGFPLPVQVSDVNGGAPDWGGGAGPNLTPDQIAKVLLGGDPDRVAQINHPDGGYLKVVEFDALTGKTFADPTAFRMPPVPGGFKPGMDTGLFSTSFTAIELLNGYGTDRFSINGAWWMTLLSRGIRWTGTAVSDTHSWTSSQSGGPRTWVRMTAPATVTGFDGRLFARDVNAGRAVGTNGPFVRVKVAAPGVATALVGDTLKLPAGATAVTIEVEVQAPEWMPFGAVELLRDVTTTVPKPGEANKTPPKPRQRTDFVLEPASDLKPGVEPGAKRWVKVVTFVEEVKADAWFVVTVHGKSKLPVALVSERSAEPFAFTNPIYVDQDGGGYDKTALPRVPKAVPPPPSPPPPPPPHGAVPSGAWQRRGFGLPVFASLRAAWPHLRAEFEKHELEH